eukprot:m.31134 g.31134  ORF g.31134 m.31134 type:complete len:409 (+) comp8282_c0_seq1:138-1364(+)
MNTVIVALAPAMLMLQGADSHDVSGCSMQQGVRFNNTNFSDPDGPRGAMDASDCCRQCIAYTKCNYWTFLNISRPGTHSNGLCYYHTINANPVSDDRFTSGGFSGQRPPPTARGPCLDATREQCGVGNPPYLNGTIVFCAQACRWNTTASALGQDGFCETRDPPGYSMPDNSSVIALVNASTPLKSDMKISFYGDSITYLDLYEGSLRSAISNGEGTKLLKNITLIDQGVNGGTVQDLVKGYSPWGHLDPHEKQTNITFAQTIQRGKPDIVAVQIGVNDVWQQPKRGANVTMYADVLQHQIVQVAKQSGAMVYLVTISVIGEQTDAKNHAELRSYADAAMAVGKAEGVYVVDVLSRDIEYDIQNNCLDLQGNVLNGGSGVHPYPAQGQMMLANAHAEGIIATLHKAAQ